MEEVCVPFDINSTHNGAMFVPTRAGWLRAGGHRNTPHGLKPGGLYLTRPGGRTEKLVEVDINSWDMSPDGCKVAFGYRESGKFEETIEILDLCFGS